LHGRISLHKRFRNGHKILHVRPKYHCFAKRARLDRILPTFGRQAFAHKNHRGVFVKKSQLACGVDE
jgi:hypothetical protein